MALERIVAAGLGRRTIAVVILAGLLSCGQVDQNQAQAQIAAQLQAGDIFSARITLLNYLDTYPDDLDQRRNLVDVLIELKQFKAAATHYALLKEHEPDSPATVERGARLASRRGDHEAVYAAFQAGDYDVLDEAVRSRYVGEALLALRRYDELERLFDSLEPRMTDTLEELRARYLVLRGDRETALDLLRTLTDRNPDSAVAWIMRAELSLSSGDSAEAIDAFKAAENAAERSGDQGLRVAAFIGLFEAHMLAGDMAAANATLARAQRDARGTVAPVWMSARVSAHAGDTATAIDTLNNLLKVLPNHAQAHALLGAQYLATGQEGLAETHLRSAVSLDPTSTQARIKLLELALSRGNEREARRLIEDLIKTAPNSALSLVMSALTQAQKGNVESALALAEKLEPMLESGAQAHATQGDVLLLTGHYAQAADAYSAAKAIANDRPLLFKLYQSSLWAGADRPEALLEDWLVANPDDHMVRFQLAARLADVGNGRAAMDHYIRILEALPDHFGALNNLAVVAQTLGDDRAEEFARRAHALAPDNPGVADTLGWLLLQRGDVSGLAYVEQAAAALPDNAEVQYHLAYARSLEGNDAEARSGVERLLERNLDPRLKAAVTALLADLGGRE